MNSEPVIRISTAGHGFLKNPTSINRALTRWLEAREPKRTFRFGGGDIARNPRKAHQVKLEPKKKRPKMTEEQRAQSMREAKARYLAKVKAAGRCVCCHKPARPNRTLCAPCAEANYLRQKKTTK